MASHRTTIPFHSILCLIAIPPPAERPRGPVRAPVGNSVENARRAMTFPPRSQGKLGTFRVLKYRVAAYWIDAELRFPFQKWTPATQCCRRPMLCNRLEGTDNGGSRRQRALTAIVGVPARRQVGHNPIQPRCPARSPPALARPSNRTSLAPAIRPRKPASPTPRPQCVPRRATAEAHRAGGEDIE